VGHRSAGYELVGNRFRGVDRDSETDSLRGKAWFRHRGDHGINADHFTSQVHQRTARISGVNRGVGLDRVVEKGAGSPLMWRLGDRSPQGAHDASSYSGSARKSESMPNCHHAVSYRKAVRFPKGNGGQIVSLDPDDREISIRIAADDVCTKGPAIRKRDRDASRACDYVVIGQCKARLVEDHPGADAGSAAGARSVGRCYTCCFKMSNDLDNPGLGAFCNLSDAELAGHSRDD
jgi:hypothetical protein